MPGNITEVIRVQTTLFYIVRKLIGISQTDFNSLIYLLNSTDYNALIKLDEMQRGDALLDATSQSDIELITLVVSSGPIATGYRAEAIVMAATTGNGTLVELLLSYPDEVEPQTTDNSYFGLVTYIRTNINDADRGRAVCAATKTGSLTVVDILLLNGNIYDEDRGYAVTLACKGNYADIVERLLVLPILKEDAGKAVVASVGVGNKDLVERILGIVKITEQDRGEAVIMAASSGRREILEILIADGIIRNSARGEALVGATTYGDYSCVQFLLTSPGFIPILSRGEALYIAAEKGNMEMVTDIIHSGTVTFMQYKASIWIAHKRGYQDIVDLLVAESMWSLDQLM
jgi:hypothetical protein